MFGFRALFKLTYCKDLSLSSLYDITWSDTTKSERFIFRQNAMLLSFDNDLADIQLDLTWSVPAAFQLNGQVFSTSEGRWMPEHWAA